MKRFGRLICRGWFAVISAAILLSLIGCAAELRSHSGQPPPDMLGPVLALYNEGARLFQEKDFQRAKEKYHTALDQAKTLGDTPGIGFSLAGMGASQQALQEYDQALESFKAALPYFKASQNVGVEALTLAAIGEVQIQLNQDSRATEAFQQALIIAESLFEKASDQDKLFILTNRQKVLLLQAQAHERLGNYTDAIKSYRAAANDSKKTGNHALAGAALWGGAALAKKAGALKDAIGLFTEASSILKSGGLAKDSIGVDSELARIYLDVGESQKSIALFSEVANLAEREKDTESAASANFGLGQAFEGLSDFEKALASYRSALGYLRAADWKDKTRLEADTLLHMGVMHRWLSQYEVAIENLRMAASKYLVTGNAIRQADAFAQLAEVFYWIAEPSIAVGYYKRALEIYRKMGDLPKQIEILAALGEAGYLTDEVSTEDGQKYFNAGQRLVDLLTGYDQYVRVKTAAKEKKLTDDDVKRIWSEWRQKLPTLNPAHRIAAGILYQKWGRIFLEDKNSLNAVGFLLTALDYHSIPMSSDSRPFNRHLAIELAKDSYGLGEAFRRLGANERALQYFRTVEQIATALRTPEIHYAFSGLARTYADLGDTDKALEFYKKGVAELESIQGQQGTEEIKMGVFAGAMYSYRDLLRLLLDVYKRTNDEQYLRDSFEYNERMRARVFLEILGRSNTTRLNKNVGAEVRSQDEIRRNIAQIHHRLQSGKLEPFEESKLLDQLENLRGKWRNLQKEMVRQDPKHSGILSTQPTSVASVQAALDADAVLLEYMTAHDSSILWAITKEQIRAYTLPGAGRDANLEKYLKTLRQPLIGVDEISSHEELGQKLYRELVGPAEELIRPKKHIIVAADGPLHYLPFEALIVPQGLPRSGPVTRLADVEYLIKKYQVTYIPSASVLVAQHSGQQPKTPRAELPLIAFGDPIYGDGNLQDQEINPNKITNLALRGQNLERLEFSGEEVLRIARILGVSADSQHINLRDRATLERVRSLDLSRYRVLHFAAHAVLGDQIKRLSQPALVLSQPEGGKIEEGLLQFSDILELKLNADLVVLSACETGLGRLREGEGVIGLTRAFLYAGASSAVVSLWKVQDQSTSLLMERFYQNLKSGLAKTEALRQAKLEIMRSTTTLKATGMRQDLAAPFYWAPFVLVGDSRPLRSQ